MDNLGYMQTYTGPYIYVMYERMCTEEDPMGLDFRNRMWKRFARYTEFNFEEAVKRYGSENVRIRDQQ